jgi:hypothetical protein
MVPAPAPPSSKSTNCRKPSPPATRPPVLLTGRRSGWAISHFPRRLKNGRGKGAADIGPGVPGPMSDLRSPRPGHCAQRDHRAADRLVLPVEADDPQAFLAGIFCVGVSEIFRDFLRRVEFRHVTQVHDAGGGWLHRFSWLVGQRRQRAGRGPAGEVLRVTIAMVAGFPMRLNRRLSRLRHLRGEDAEVVAVGHRRPAGEAILQIGSGLLHRPREPDHENQRRLPAGRLRPTPPTPRRRPLRGLKPPAATALRPPFALPLNKPSPISFFHRQFFSRPRIPKSLSPTSGQD